MPSLPLASAAPAQAPQSGSLKDRVKSVIDWLRPIIQSDGGDLELVDVSAEGVVQVRFHGACIGCPSSSITLRQGIERNIREKVPEVREVRAVNE
jgi:Fe-S cluster biogenesis protein NfuA